MKSAFTPAEAARALTEQLGDVESFDVLHNCLLVAIYHRPETTKGGIVLPESVRKEDAYQSKVGLIVKKGPLAFREDARTDFGGKNPEIGEWAVFKVGDGWAIGINGVPCRIVQDVNIRATVTDPAAIW